MYIFIPCFMLERMRGSYLIAVFVIALLKYKLTRQKEPQNIVSSFSFLQDTGCPGTLGLDCGYPAVLEHACNFWSDNPLQYFTLLFF
jgi:hypothetical protein